MMKKHDGEGFRTGVVTASDTGRVEEHWTGFTMRNGEIVGFVESMRNGRAAFGDLKPSGEVVFGFTGRAPQNEEGTLAACKRLVEHLRTECGEPWSDPDDTVVIKHVDVVVEGTGRLQGQRLLIQVVRALTDEKYWKGSARPSPPGLPSEVVIKIEAAIRLKEERIPHERRKEIVLVLDAGAAAGLALGAVVTEFNRIHGDRADEQGFAAIWMVGPDLRMIGRLGSGGS